MSHSAPLGAFLGRNVLLFARHGSAKPNDYILDRSKHEILVSPEDRKYGCLPVDDWRLQQIALQFGGPDGIAIDCLGIGLSDR